MGQAQSALESISRPRTPLPPTLDHTTHPRVLSTTLSHADHTTLLTFRTTSRTLRTKVDTLLARHLLLHFSPTAFRFVEICTLHPGPDRTVHLLPSLAAWHTTNTPAGHAGREAALRATLWSARVADVVSSGETSEDQLASAKLLLSAMHGLHTLRLEGGIGVGIPLRACVPVSVRRIVVRCAAGWFPFEMLPVGCRRVVAVVAPSTVLGVERGYFMDGSVGEVVIIATRGVWDAEGRERFVADAQRLVHWLVGSRTRCVVVVKGVALRDLAGDQGEMSWIATHAAVWNWDEYLRRRGEREADVEAWN